MEEEKEKLSNFGMVERNFQRNLEFTHDSVSASLLVVAEEIINLKDVVDEIGSVLGDNTLFEKIN